MRQLATWTLRWPPSSRSSTVENLAVCFCACHGVMLYSLRICSCRLVPWSETLCLRKESKVFEDTSQVRRAVVDASCHPLLVYNVALGLQPDHAQVCCLSFAVQ